MTLFYEYINELNNFTANENLEKIVNKKNDEM